MAWFETNQRELPFRYTKDIYKIWLSEIIFQQTQIKQGLPYYQRFIEAFPTIEALANAHEQEVLKLWEGLGYYSRARNLHHCAKAVVATYGGEFPADYKSLTSTQRDWGLYRPSHFVLWLQSPLRRRRWQCL